MTNTEEIIGDMVVEIPAVTAAENSKAVFDLFEATPELEGVVVLEDAIPAGLVMRNHFYQKMAAPFGYSVYMNRSVVFIMDASPMVIDYYTELNTVGIAAMDRPQSNLYDFILVSKNNQYIGAISIRHFLIELSRKDAEKLRMLQLKSASVKNLLDNAGQGFLSFGADGRIEEEYSVECINILGRQLEQTNYNELMHELLPPEQASLQTIVLSSYFDSDSATKDDAFLRLMPRECELGSKTIRFDYKPIHFFGQKKLMVVLTDITEKVVMERQMEQERRNQRLVIKALTHTGELKSMIEHLHHFLQSEAHSILQSKQSTARALQEMYRYIHTFKGDFAQFGLHHSSQNLHILEDELQTLLDSKQEIDSQQIQQWLQKVNPQLITQQDTEIITNLLGTDFLEANKTLIVQEESIQAIESTIKDTCSPLQYQMIWPMIHKLRCCNVKSLIEQYKDYVKYLAERLDKPVPQFSIEGDDIWIDKNHYSPVIKSLTHLFRNMCDHGIEIPDERIAAGKHEIGSISCDISSVDDRNLHIRISDDGRGIDSAHIIERALQNKIITKEQSQQLTAEQSIQMIFMQGLSTKAKATELSGRGVGMTAVSEAVKNTGGHIEVTSQIGIGTTYSLTFPIK